MLTAYFSGGRKHFRRPNFIISMPESVEQHHISGRPVPSHEPFDWSNEAVRDELDIVSHQEAVEYRDKRILVGDTDVGKRMMIRIEELKKLIQAYQDGEIAERDASSAYKW